MGDPENELLSKPKEKQSDLSSSGNPASQDLEAHTRVAELERELEKTREQLSEHKNKYLYLYAEFENFKRSVVRERAELIKFGWEPLAKELLENLDNLERAVSHMPQGADRTLIEGLKLVLKQLKATLEKYGVKIIETEKLAFNPDLHEAIAQVPSVETRGTIVEQHTPGYTLHGRLLRPARVTVSSGKAEENQDPTNKSDVESKPKKKAAENLDPLNSKFKKVS